MALTINEETKLKAIAAAAIKADAVAALQVTRDSETAAAQTAYEAAVKTATGKFHAGALALEK